MASGTIRSRHTESLRLVARRSRIDRLIYGQALSRLLFSVSALRVEGTILPGVAKLATVAAKAGSAASFKASFRLSKTTLQVRRRSRSVNQLWTDFHNISSSLNLATTRMTGRLDPSQ